MTSKAEMMNILICERLFLRAILGLKQNWEDGIEISHVPPVIAHA